MTDTVLIALIGAIFTAVGASLPKMLEYLGTTKRATFESAAAREIRLEARIQRLEERLEAAERHNDELVIENAKLNARVGVLEAQNAVQAQQLAAITVERDTLRQQLES